VGHIGLGGERGTEEDESSGLDVTPMNFMNPTAPGSCCSRPAGRFSPWGEREWEREKGAEEAEEEEEKEEAEREKRSDGSSGRGDEEESGGGVGGLCCADGGQGVWRGGEERGEMTTPLPMDDCAGIEGEEGDDEMGIGGEEGKKEGEGEGDE
jgi:hypothetical protein